MNVWREEQVKNGSIYRVVRCWALVGSSTIQRVDTLRPLETYLAVIDEEIMPADAGFLLACRCWMHG